MRLTHNLNTPTRDFLTLQQAKNREDGLPFAELETKLPLSPNSFGDDVNLAGASEQGREQGAKKR